MGLIMTALTAITKQIINLVLQFTWIQSIMKLDWGILDNGDIVQCEYKATQKYSLIKLHVDSKHVGEKYGCNECDSKVG